MKTTAAAIALALASKGLTQIVPQYDYNGVNQPFWVTLKGESKGSELRILEPDGKEVARSKTAVDRVDLATAFPSLWKIKNPHVLYCQGFFKDHPVGAALVLQPMVNPPLSRLKADEKTVEFVPQDLAYAGVRAWVDQDILFHTSMGEMKFRMRPDCAPNTVWTIMHLVSGGFYRNLIWHRVVAISHGFPFVIQGGDPTGNGDGGPGFAYALEDSPLPHDLGVISIARDADPNTNGCQVFVCLSREGTARLDHKYASFGQCIEGLEVVKKIGAVNVGKEDRPFRPPVIENAELVDATSRFSKVHISS